MIYPPELAEEFDNEGERLVHELLKSNFGSSTSVDIYHSRRFRRKGYVRGMPERKEYEIDFIIIDPSRGVLCVEVKGGQIEFDGNRWYQNGHAMDKDPLSQVRGAAKSLESHYTDVFRSLGFDSLLIFPECELIPGKPLPELMTGEMVIDEASLGKMKNRIENYLTKIQKEFHKSGLTPERYGPFKESLLRQIGSVQRLGTRILRDEGALITLTDDQLAKVVMLCQGRNKKMAIRGPAGSGKSLIAREVAEHYADLGQDVLLLCYNDLLSFEFRNHFKEKRNVKTSSFLKFASRVLRAERGNVERDPDSFSEDYQRKDLPDQFSSLPAESIPKYDLIIVDEGQDFYKEWFELLTLCLKGDQRFYVFLDERQDLFGHFKGLPDSIPMYDYPLLENCRNTRHIVDFLSKTIGENINTYKGTPEGTAVVIREYREESEQRKLLEEDVQNLLTKDMVRPDQIMILQNKPKKQSSISDLRQIAGHQLESLGRDPGVETIRFTTIERFKGMEADVVIILDIDALPEADRARSLYAQGSRAKHKLFLYRQK